MLSLSLIFMFVLSASAVQFVLCSIWIQLPELRPTSDSLTMHTETLAPDNVLVDDRYGLAAPAPALAEDVSSSSVTPIKYEDLVHIVGPGLEEELEKFYDQHRHELEESTRKTYPAAKPPQIYVPEDDPWSIYDKPLVSTTKRPIFANTTLENSSPPNRQQINNHPKLLTTTRKPKTQPNTTIKKQKLVRLVMKQPATSGLFGFAQFLAFLKSIQNSFVTNTSRRSIQDKIKMLENFRDDMLRNIKHRINQLWPTPVTRSKRSHHDDDSGHGSMDFPSSEGALMTLSFLTFAVFLIKLVLQVINTIKSEHYSYNGFDTTNVVSPVSVLATIKENQNARNIRSTDDKFPGFHLDANHILHAIEGLKNHNFN